MTASIRQSLAPRSRTLLEARGISVELGRRRVLDDVSFALEAGSLCALVGPNGAGKSTLLRALAGVVALTSGTISPAAPTEPHARGPVAYLPQDRIVHWDLSVERVVALGRPGLGTADTAAVAAALARMDVAHLAARPIREISGGERARVLIARALAQDTPVLLADEPVAGLDPAHQLALFAVLGGLARDGRAVLVALHDLSLAARYADRVIVLDGGRIAADGPPSQALSAATIASVFGMSSRLTTVEGIPVVVALAPIVKPPPPRD